MEIVNLCPYHIAELYGKKRIRRLDSDNGTQVICSKCNRQGHEFEIKSLGED